MVDNVVNNPPRSSKKDLCGEATSTLNQLELACLIFLIIYLLINYLSKNFDVKKVSRSAP